MLLLNNICLNLRLLLLFILYLTYSFEYCSAATPTISSVVVSYSEAYQCNILTITGSNLSNDVKTNWNSFFITHTNASSFEGSSLSADGYSAIGPSGGTYVTDVKILGSQSIKFHVQGACSDVANNLGNYNAFSATSTDAWYIRSYVRYYSRNNDWPTSQIKMLYPWIYGSCEFEPSSGIGLPTKMKLEFPDTIGGSLVSHYGDIPSGQLQNNRWYCFELRLGKDHTVQAWVDGELIYTGTSPTDTGQPALLFGIVNACGTNSDFYLDSWMDGLAISSSRVYPASMVQIGNSPDKDYANPVNQELLFISDSEMIVKYSSESGNYLWVTNNGQETSSVFQFGAKSLGSPSSFSGGTIQ